MAIRSRRAHSLWRSAVLLALAVCIAAGGHRSAEADAGGQQPGQRIVVLPADLPQPFATVSATNIANRIRRPADAGLAVPPGFEIALFADGLQNPRNIIVAPNGDIIVAESGPGRIVILRGADGKEAAERRFTYADGLERPFGLALRPDGLYVADIDAVWRFDYAPGDTIARSRPARVTTPGAFGPKGGHWTRNIAFSPDGERFYVSVGSMRNIGEDAAPRATIQEFRRDGSGQKTFASGMRNAVGLAVDAHTGQLFAVVNERDGLGDGLVPDYLTEVHDGDFYGWPYAYIGHNPQPGLADRRPDLVARSKVPDTLFRAHSAPIGMALYTGSQFPERYRNGFFVALQGSWNANAPTGYMVAFVPTHAGPNGALRPDPGYEVFASGFWISGTDRATIWGQPAGIAVAKDGSLLISDDMGGTIWRVTWQGR